MNIALPVLALATPGQRYTCHGCGNCCRDFTVQLRPKDVARIVEQGWMARLATNPIVSFRGQHYLRQRADGACIFLMGDGRCQVHAEYGFEAKPIACQMFPYMVAPSHATAQMGVSFACQSVVENKGKLVNEQVNDALRIALRGLPETLRPVTGLTLAHKRLAEPGEIEWFTKRLVAWIESDSPLRIRLDGIAWIAQALAVARLTRVRGARWNELLDVLFDALAAELPLHPIAPPSPRQIAQLQSAIFSRTEDPKPLAQGAPSRLMSIVNQLRRSRAWRTGRGTRVVPAMGSQSGGSASFAQVWRVTAASDTHESEAQAREAIDALMTRWLRASIEGGRSWGSGYYGWNAVDGLAALCITTASIGWVARYEAAREARASVTLDDVRRAVRRIDRTAGRAPWLGRTSERLRIAFLVRDDGLRRVLHGHF